jgi:hypothetical protein
LKKKPLDLNTDLPVLFLVSGIETWYGM